MQQTYDMWLKKHNPGKPGEGTPISSREGEKQIQMPTDYADIMVTAHECSAPECLGRGWGQGWGGLPRQLYPQMGYHCWLCGKNSNSKKQWQQHIQSEKHKEKVFTSDSDTSGWAYRFPMGEFRLCDRCPGTRGCWAHNLEAKASWASLGLGVHTGQHVPGQLLPGIRATGSQAG